MGDRRDRRIETPLHMYACSVKKAADVNPLLNAKEEKALLKKARRGDIDARDRLVESNLRLVINVAKGYRGRGLEYIDLIQEGNIGLLKAIKRFDLRRKTRLTTYAVFWIRQSIESAIKNKARTVRLPVNFQEAMYRIERFRQKFYLLYCRWPTDEEIAQETGLTPKRVQKILNQSVTSVSLTNDRDDIGLPMAELDIADEDSPGVETPVEIEELKQIIEQALESLIRICKQRNDMNTIRDISIFIERACDEAILVQISKKHKISRERVRQITKNKAAQLQRVMALAGIDSEHCNLS